MSDRADHAAVIRALTQHECLALLERNHVGRIAFSHHDQVDIRPLNYVYEAGWLYGRTSEGDTLSSLTHRPWVAFEVDEIVGPFDWRSVVVRGSFHRMDERVYEGVHAHALTLLRSVVSETFTEADPAPSRSVLFRIAVGEITGRSAASGPRNASRGDLVQERSPLIEPEPRDGRESGRMDDERRSSRG